MRTTTMIAAVLVLAGTMQADVFNMGPGLTSLETVPVGDAGNAGDTRYETPGYGAVNYEFRIGKYEVTAGQYTVFLNAVAATDTYGLYNTEMWTESDGCKIQQSGSSSSHTYTVAPDWANHPVSHVSWGDAARFANWLHNGQQGPATTEDGAYCLTATHGYYGLNGETPEWGTPGWYALNAAMMAVSRKADAKWAIPTEDEWYKAAYYKGGSTNAGYWDYPTSSNTAPGQDRDDFSGNNANYLNYPYTTLVGEFQKSDSPYGTFDQGGNVYEWNEANIGGYYRGERGGACWNYDTQLQAAYRNYNYPTIDFLGFRVSQVPEPATLSLLALGGMALLRKRTK